MAWNGALVLVTALFSGSSPPRGPSWQWPLRPPVEVVRSFDPPAHPWEAGHRGVDLAARPGQVVYAAGAGRVGFARDLAGRGVVTVIHGRLRTTYLPVSPSVHAGRVVAAGTPIGVVEDVPGHCGRTACLHWGLRQGVTYLDPLILLGRGPVRLLPWWDAAARWPDEARPHGAEGDGAPYTSGRWASPPETPRATPYAARAPVPHSDASRFSDRWPTIPSGPSGHAPRHASSGPSGPSGRAPRHASSGGHEPVIPFALGAAGALAVIPLRLRGIRGGRVIHRT
jgi:hypothetical protein